MRDWRLGVQEALGRFSADAGPLDQAAARARLEARLARVEAGVKEALDAAGEGCVSAEEAENMYRLLGAYRGLSEALVGFVQRFAPIDWVRLREARF